jgi:hypothetical protein
VWTPKRVLLLVLGFAVFLTAYLVYANVLGFGGIDGLPPLPQAFWRVPGQHEPEPLVRDVNSVERKLILAFGDDERIKNAPIRLELRARGLVLAAEHFQIENDGRARFTPFYLAVFGKDRGDNRFPEINTIRSNDAWLTFDRPVSNVMEMGSRKIVGAELKGDITIVNNRRTPNQDDDPCLLTQGPLFYDESQHIISTTEAVRIVDPQSKPEPMTITATGMDISLTVEEAAPAGKAAANPKKAKSENVSGVDRITLRGDVDMNLFVDSRSGFLSNGDDTKKGKPPAKKPQPAAQGSKAEPGPKDAAKTPDAKPAAEPEKARVNIQTAGPFVYDLRNDRATYDIAHRQTSTPNNVVVKRLNDKEGKLEQLVCDHLDLQFHRKNAADAGGASAADRSVDLEIETAHATGANVTLTSDNENLNAFGTDLYYEARNKLSILKGEPEMVAAKDGSFIHARELRLRTDANGSQQASARGPGFIEMLDRTSGQRPMLARWKNELIYSKDGNYDLLVLTGDASFEDKEHAQQMYGDTLKVWLEPADEKKPAAGDEQQRRLPHHVEALGHVRTSSPDMRVHDSDRLILWFHDVAAAEMPGAPAPAAKGPATQAAAPKQATPAEAPKGAEQPAPDKAVARTEEKAAQPSAGGAAPGKPAPAAEASKPKKPMDLSARSIEAHVLRCGGKNDLDRLWCEGRVRVLQEPATPEEKGVDIRGETLNLKHFADGNELTVTANELAQVQLEQLFILGPEVNIHQTTNKAWVNGPGAMRMPSNTNFDGAKLNKPAELIVYWKKSMYFNGKDAEFQGSIQAEQENARLLCQRLQVYLDRRVSFREGQKDGQQAKVEKLVCDKNVRIEDSTRENGRLVSYKRIDSKELALDNEDGIVNAPGPGVVRILQLGAQGELIPTTPAAGANAAGPQPAHGNHTGQGKAPQPAAKEDDVLKLTRVSYRTRMWANNNTRTAIFYDDIELLHLPAENPDLVIDLDHLPREALHLRCQKLQIYTRRTPDGKASQEMEAQKKCVVQAQEFWAVAEVVKYDESQQKLIFEGGGEGGMARLYKVAVRGAEAEDVIGRKITYWRETGAYKVDGGRGIKVGN